MPLFALRGLLGYGACGHPPYSSDCRSGPSLFTPDNVSYRTGCQFSVGQKLLASAKAGGNSAIRKQSRQKNVADSMGERGRACACVPRVCHPCAPAALRTHGTSFSHDCTKGGHVAPRATSARKTTRAGPRGSVQAREHEDRDLAARLVLILDKNRHLGGLAVEQALALLPSGHGGLDPKALGAHFDRRLRVREEVVVPGGVRGGAGERGDHDEALAICGVH